MENFEPVLNFRLCWLWRMNTESNEMTELRRVKYRDSSSSPVRSANFDEKPKMVTFIEVPVDKNDTLQGLSLRYACKTNEIKRINFIVNDIELHAKHTCRIPIKENSYLSEMYKKDLQRISASELSLLTKRLDESPEFEYETWANDTDMDNMLADSDSNMNIPLLAADSLRPPSVVPKQSQRDEAISFLKNMDKDLETIKATAVQQNISIAPKANDPTKSVLILSPSSNNQFSKEVTSMNLTTREIFVICFLVIVIVPLLIFGYLEYVS